MVIAHIVVAVHPTVIALKYAVMAKYFYKEAEIYVVAANFIIHLAMCVAMEK